ncbi:MAG: hypothetical protein V1820_03665 [archaeon]
MKPGKLILAAMLISLTVLSGCSMSLGDNVQFGQFGKEVLAETARTYEGDFLPLQEEYRAEMLLSAANGTFAYSETRRSLSRANAWSNLHRLISPLYSCFDISFDSPPQRFICPDEFKSFSDFREDIYSVALSRNSVASRVPSLFAIHYPFPVLTVNGQGMKLENFSASSKPSYSEIMRMAEKPMRLTSVNSTEERAGFSAGFETGDTLCVDFGFLPKRSQEISVASDLPFLNYTFYGRLPESNMRVERTQQGRLVFKYDAFDPEYMNLTLAKVCFGRTGG